MPAIFDQKMLQLIDQIRSHVPTHQKPDINVDNISLMLNLLEVFDQSKDSSLKSLIKQLFDYAGNSWSRLLALREPSNLVETSSKKAERITSSTHQSN